MLVYIAFDYDVERLDISETWDAVEKGRPGHQIDIPEELARRFWAARDAYVGAAEEISQIDLDLERPTRDEELAKLVRDRQDAERQWQQPRQ